MLGMNISIILISLLIGTSIGYIYGLSFVSQQKKALSLEHKIHAPSRYPRLFIVSGALRITLFACFLWFLLRQFETDFILVVISFFTAFWYAIVRKGNILHGRSGSR